MEWLGQLGVGLTSEQLDERVKRYFEGKGFRWVFHQTLSGTELAQRDSIKEHYLMYSRAACAKSAEDLGVTDVGKAHFNAEFGKAWETEVAAGRLSLREVVRLMGTGPAEVYGLRDKGCLAPGCEADLVLVDPQAEWTVGERPLFTRCGWSPFGGRRLRGRVVQVWLRGQLAYDEGQVRARPTPRNLLTIP